MLLLLLRRFSGSCHKEENKLKYKKKVENFNGMYTPYV